MIDHVSLPFAISPRSAAFYERLLAPLGYTQARGAPCQRSGSARSIPSSGSTCAPTWRRAVQSRGARRPARVERGGGARLSRGGAGGRRCQRRRAGTPAGGDDDLLRRLRPRSRRQQAGSGVLPGGVAGFYAAANTNPVERLDRAIRRRTNVVSIFPNEAAIVRFIDAIPLEQNDPSLSHSQGHLRPVGGLPYSVVFPSKCASVAWASARVARAMPSRCSGGA